MPLQYTPRRSRRPTRFPNAIRRYRLQAGLTQRALGQLLGRSRNVISAWERGLTEPRMSTGMRMAKILSTLGESLYRHFYSPEPKQEGDTDNRSAA